MAAARPRPLNGSVGGTEGEMDTRSPRLSPPDRKISETFLHFAAPMLHDLTSEAPEQRAEEVLRVAFTVWNAVVLADVLKDHSHLEKARSLAADQPEVAVLMEQLVARKRALFGDDERLIGTWEVTRTPDGINVRADARDPHTMSRAPE